MKTMKRTYRLLLTLMLIIISSLVLFYLLPGIIASSFVELEVKNISLIGKQADEMLLNVSLKIINKSNLAFKLKNADIMIRIQNNPIAESRYSTEIEILKEQDMNLIFIIKKEQVPTLARAMNESDVLNLNYVAKIFGSLNLLGFWIDRTLEIKGYYSLKITSSMLGITLVTKEIKILEDNRNSIKLNAIIDIINKSNLNYTIKDINSKIFYKSEIGKAYVRTLNIEGNSMLSTNASLILYKSELTAELISKLLNGELNSITFYSNITIYLKDFNLFIKTYLKDNISYQGKKITDLVNLSKAIIGEKSELIVYLNNIFGVVLELEEANLNIFYKDLIVAKGDLTKVNINQGENRLKFILILNRSNLDIVINDLINLKKINLIANINFRINVFDLIISNKFNITESLYIEPYSNIKIVNINKIEKNEIQLDIKLKLSLSDKLEIAMKINQISFDVYSDSALIAKGTSLEAFDILPNNETQAALKIILNSSIQNLISKLISDNELNLKIRNIRANIIILEKNYSINLEHINSNLDNINLSIDLKPKVDEIYFIDNSTVNIKTKVIISLGKIPYINIQIFEGKSDIYLNEKYLANLTLLNQLNFYNNDTKQIILMASLKISLDEIATEFLNENRLDLTLRNLRVMVNVLGENMTINYNKNLTIRLEPPINLSINTSLIRAYYAENPKEFYIDVNVNYNISTLIKNMEILNLSLEVRSLNKVLANIHVPLNYRVIKNSDNLNLTIKIKLDENSFAEAIRAILGYDKPNITINNILFKLKINNKIYDLKVNSLPLKINFDIKIFVNIPDFTIEYPGNKVIAPFKGKINILNFTIEPQELILNAYSEKGLIASIRMISVYRESNYLISGMLEAEFTQEGISLLAKPVTQSQPLIVFINNVTIKTVINGIYINKNFNFEKPILIVIYHSFKLDYNVKILDIKNETSDNIFQIKLKIDYSYKNGIHKEVKITYARFLLENSTSVLGYGEVKNEVSLPPEQGSLEITGKIYLDKNSIGWFISNFMFGEEFSILIKNVNVTVKIYNYLINTTLMDFLLKEVGPKIKYNLENYKIISFTPQGIMLVANVTLFNPFNVSGLITFLKNDNKTIKFDIYESYKDKHGGTYLGYGYLDRTSQINASGYTKINGIIIIITNVSHLIFSHNYSKKPLQLDIKVLIDLKGYFALQLNEFYTLVKFTLKDIPIEFTFSLI